VKVPVQTQRIRSLLSGLAYLGAFADAAEFPVLGACNMDTSAEPLLNGKIKKWATFKRGGMNIAVFGYTNVQESKEMATLTKNLKFYDYVRPVQCLDAAHTDCGCFGSPCLSDNGNCCCIGASVQSVLEHEGPQFAVNNLHVYSVLGIVRCTICAEFSEDSPHL
jgi:hypothetical protein